MNVDGFKESMDNIHPKEYYDFVHAFATYLKTTKSIINDEWYTYNFNVKIKKDGDIVICNPCLTLGP